MNIKTQTLIPADIKITIVPPKRAPRRYSKGTTRVSNEAQLQATLKSGCPHCGTKLDRCTHSEGGIVYICNNLKCSARTVHEAYYYISNTNERIFSQ